LFYFILTVLFVSLLPLMLVNKECLCVTNYFLKILFLLCDTVSLVTGRTSHREWIPGVAV